jgi:penicillin-binding protein 1C
VWRTLVHHLHAGRPSRAPGLPALPVALQTRPVPAGSATPTVAPSRRAIGITNPLDGSVFALDPDVPPAAQRITFAGEPGTWVLDGRPLGRGATVQWAPWPGRHELQLLGPDGKTLQVVRFEVRGAALKPGAPGARQAASAQATPHGLTPARAVSAGLNPTAR